MQVRSEEERQSGSSSGCAGRLRVHMPAWSSDLSCRTSLWPSLGRLLCARVMSIEHDAFFSFYRPQVALPIKTGGEVLGVPMSIGKHRRGRPGKAGVDYQGHTGRRVQRRGDAGWERGGGSCVSSPFLRRAYFSSCVSSPFFTARTVHFFAISSACTYSSLFAIFGCAVLYFYLESGE